MKNSIVGLKELRENLEDYIVSVKRGKSFLVVRRSKPVFKISPPSDENEPWELVADFTKVKKGGVSAKEILRELRKLNA
ncbi:MAG: type II toxin-antitoxin system prevent-host-death family antitoxin [Patescibacteria group bacterium]